MNVYDALSTFKDKCPREALVDIIGMSQQLGHLDKVMKGVGIAEAFEVFEEYVNCFIEYMLGNEKDESALIVEATTQFITEKCVTEVTVKYPDIPRTINDYLSGVTKLEKSIEGWQEQLLQAGYTTESGMVMTFCEEFLDRLNRDVYQYVDTLKLVSGYETRKNLFPKKPVSKPSAGDFLF